MSATTERAYVGWHRTSNRVPWVAVCRGDSAEAVLSKLLDCTRGGDKMVLAAGVDPNERTRSGYAQG